MLEEFIPCNGGSVLLLDLSRHGCNTIERFLSAHLTEGTPVKVIHYSPTQKRRRDTGKYGNSETIVCSIRMLPIRAEIVKRIVVCSTAAPYMIQNVLDELTSLAPHELYLVTLGKIGKTGYVEKINFKGYFRAESIVGRDWLLLRFKRLAGHGSAEGDIV